MRSLFSQNRSLCCIVFYLGWGQNENFMGDCQLEDFFKTYVVLIFEIRIIVKGIGFFKALESDFIRIAKYKKC